MSSVFAFGRRRALAGLLALGIVSGLSASQAKAAKKLEYLPALVSVDKPATTGSKPGPLVYVNVGRGTLVQTSVNGVKGVYMQFVITSSLVKTQAFNVSLSTKVTSAHKDDLGPIVIPKSDIPKGESEPAGGITFFPGMTSEIVYVKINVVPDELTGPKSFYLVTTNPTGNVQLKDGEGLGTIP